MFRQTHPLYFCCILTFDPAKHAIPKWCTRRKWHIPMPSNRKKSLTKWDKVKSHDTLIDWCTGREWPLNCMTVYSAWWRSNMPFQRLSGRLNYYITRWGQEVSELGTREAILSSILFSFINSCCGRESHRPAEGALGPLIELDIRRVGGDVVGKATTQQKGSSGPPMELGDQRSR